MAQQHPRPRRRKLPADAADRARKLAALGMPLASIAAALGVHRCTLHEWRQSEPDLADAIQGGWQEGEAALVERLHRCATEGDARSAQWLLTHSPAWRDHWSDAAAERRAVAASRARTVEAIEASTLTAEQRRELYLRLAAAGEHPEPDGLLGFHSG